MMHYSDLLAIVLTALSVIGFVIDKHYRKNFLTFFSWLKNIPFFDIVIDLSKKLFALTIIVCLVLSFILIPITFLLYLSKNAPFSYAVNSFWIFTWLLRIIQNDRVAKTIDENLSYD